MKLIAKYIINYFYFFNLKNYKIFNKLLYSFPSFLPILFLFTFPLYSEEVLIKDGVLDLSKRDYILNNIIELKGEWKYSFSSNFEQNLKISDQLIHLPYLWNYSIHKNEKNSFGHGLYQLKIIFPKSIIENKKSVSLYLQRSSLEHKIEIINRKEEIIGSSYSNSNLGNEKLNFRKPSIITFFPENIVYLNFYVRNKYHYFGGPNSSIKMGYSDKIILSKVIKSLLDGILYGVLLIIGIYHFTLYIIRRKDKTTFWFGLFCVISFAWSFIDQNYVELIEDSIYTFYITQYIFEFCFFSMTYIFVLYLHRLLDLKDILNKSKKIFVSICLVLVIVNLLIPLKYTFHIYLRYAFYSTIIYSIFWMILALFFSIKNNNNYIAKIILLGMFAIFIAAGHDVFYNKEIMRGNTISYIPYGIIVFLLFQAFVIAIKNQNAYSLAERLTNNLEKIVEARTGELNKAFTIIKNDLKVAKNIQSKLLPLDLTKISNLNIVSKYIPMGEVGGDLFDIYDLGEGNIRILMGDATGHGVRAALVTMLIKGEYDSLKDTIYSPSELLSEFNTVFYKKYPNLNYFFTCFVIDVNTKKRTFKYASAGHPDQLFLNKKNIERLSKTGILPGIKSNVKYSEISFNYSKGDKLILFTDGFFEEFNKKQIEFGEELLFAIISKNKNKKVNSIINNCFKELGTFMDGEPSNDDITVLGIELG